MLSRRSLPLLLALLLGACGQPQTAVSVPQTAPTAQPTPVKPAPVLGGVYEIHFQNIGGNQPSSAARLIVPVVGTQALTDLPDAAISLQPVGLDTFVVGGVRHVRAVYRVTNNTGQPIQHLSFVPINTDDADSDPTNNTSTPTVGATYFSRLLTFGGTDASGRATALTPTSGKIFSAAQGAALPDPEATPYAALDTSPLNPAAPAGLVVASRSPNAWRSAAALAPGASTNVTFAVDLTTDTPQTDPFSFSVVLTVADDVNTAPSLVPAASSTPRLSLPVSSPATSPAAYVSGALGDSTDPASSTGLDFTVADSDTPAGSLTLSATSSDAGIATVAVSGTGATRTVRITPQSVGKADITVTVSDGTLSSSYVVKYASSKASSTPGTTLYHTGESNASSAIAVDSDYMFVADDEYNALRLYPRTASGLAVSSFDFSAQLALPDAANPELDLEASTRSGNRLYWLASHSNSKNGKLRPNRYRLFATDLSGSGAGSTLSYVGRFDNLRSDLLAWDSSNGHGLGADYLGLNASAALDVAPEAAGGVGFNIEGLSFAPGSTSTAYLAFRAPNLPTTSRTKALIVPVTNFDALVTGAAQANFGAPIFLDLGGRGIRELKCSASSCLILAGPATGGSNFALYTWSGNAADAPQLRNDLTALATDSEGSLESIVDLPASDLTTSAADGAVLRLLSDNGDTVYYADGVGAKDLITPDAQKNWQKFRSDTVALGSAQTCTVNSVSVSPSTPSITAGMSSTFSASVTTTPPNCPVVVTWSSSDTTKATIQSTTGVATAVAAGSTTITATAQGYGSAPMTSNTSLTVNAAPDYTLTLGTPTPATFTAGTAGSATATLTVNPSNGYSGTPTYSVSSSPTGITGSVSGSTVNLSIPGSLGAGTYAVTVTGTDGALVHTSNPVTVTVSAVALPNVVVYRVGDGTAALSNAATPVFLNTYSGANGTFINTIGLPTAVSGAIAA
ncbi:DUF3616 domain-containing protein (plasmid) [Deinococcus sp. KNUC1210]|uniref:DUF3616 domain-containing protein n=1 Tax=Deinococcus sp. KNUC1210 TaxID=2917691 RepID=UPI001EEF7C62|nr:DUF3616 domain-containing protein [Deinococcus sp. KNUC1210]ULH13876.1 DUF3616 domain-containing protein [Deinococcus sp. KNUC1210]